MFGNYQRTASYIVVAIARPVVVDVGQAIVIAVTAVKLVGILEFLL